MRIIGKIVLLPFAAALALAVAALDHGGKSIL